MLLIPWRSLDVMIYAQRWGRTVREIARVPPVQFGEGRRHHYCVNTFDAHRVLHMAHAEGRQVEVMDRLLAAYFGEGEPIGDRDALARIAGGAGLDPAAVGAMLAGDQYAADVRGDEREAAALGITAVPFFVINRRFGLAGAHPADSLRAAIEQARAG